MSYAEGFVELSIQLDLVCTWIRWKKGLSWAVSVFYISLGHPFPLDINCSFSRFRHLVSGHLNVLKN
jgi:hypothetical protein